jgi:hypothetical protein
VVELIQVVISILNLISTWRALLPLAIAIAVAFAVSLLIPSGRALAIAICGILIVGASIGIRWQYQHERRAKSRR